MSDQSNSIKIAVKSKFLANKLPEQQDKFAFAYRVKISNHGHQDVTLLNRYWLITDGNGKKTEVKGAGVVGKQPCIEAGSSYFYTSGAVLETPVGTMQGYYEMQSECGETFKAPIEVFGLAVPHLVN